MEKSKYFSWQQELRNGVKVLRNKEAFLQVNDNQLKPLDAIEKEKSLGVCIGPSLKQVKQFAMMKEKLERAM